MQVLWNSNGLWLLLPETFLKYRVSIACVQPGGRKGRCRRHEPARFLCPGAAHDRNCVVAVGAGRNIQALLLVQNVFIIPTLFAYNFHFRKIYAVYIGSINPLNYDYLTSSNPNSCDCASFRIFSRILRFGNIRMIMNV